MTRNVFRAFLDLVPDPPRQVAKVVQVDGDLITVELPSGGRLPVIGTAAEGDSVFVRDGVIEGAAPELPVVLITV